MIATLPFPPPVISQNRLLLPWLSKNILRQPSQYSAFESFLILVALPHLGSLVFEDNLSFRSYFK